MSSPEPNASWEFQDFKIPGWILNRMREGEVNGTHILIFALISASTKHHEEGRGYFGTNAKMAEAIGIHPMNVSKAIQHLKEKGYLMVFQFQGTRYLELEWGRTGDEREALTGSYGKALRKVYRQTQKLIRDKDRKVQEKPPQTPLSENASGLSEKTYPGLSEKTYAYRLNNIKSEKSLPRAGDGRSRARFNLNGEPHTNGLVKVKKEVEFTEQDVELARVLRKVAVKVKRMKLSCSVNTWAKKVAIVRRKLNDDYERLTSLFEWYEDQSSSEAYQGPIICFPEGIKLKMILWLEDIKKKEEDKERQDHYFW